MSVQQELWLCTSGGVGLRYYSKIPWHCGRDAGKCRGEWQEFIFTGIIKALAEILYTKDIRS
jgi:hypothetical protein